MNILMGKLYRNSRHSRAATSYCKECLRHCPYISEAIIAVAKMGATAKDIIALFPQTPDRSNRPPFEDTDTSHWLHRYVEAQYCVASCVVTYMDEYAMLLKIKADYSKLNKLVHDLLSIDHTRSEVYVALSVLWERKYERGALSYAEKSIRIDERHIPGYIVKGNLFLAMNRPEAAVVSYLALSNIKEALYAAREAMKAIPQSEKALKLVGDVHASNSGGRAGGCAYFGFRVRLLMLEDKHLEKRRAIVMTRLWKTKQNAALQA